METRCLVAIVCASCASRAIPLPKHDSSFVHDSRAYVVIPTCSPFALKAGPPLLPEEISVVVKISECPPPSRSVLLVVPVETVGMVRDCLVLMPPSTSAGYPTAVMRSPFLTELSDDSCWIVGNVPLILRSATSVYRDERSTSPVSTSLSMSVAVLLVADFCQVFSSVRRIGSSDVWIT